MFSKPFLLNGLTNYMRNMIITHILIQLLHILLHITNFITVHVLHNYYMHIQELRQHDISQLTSKYTCTTSYHILSLYNKLAPCK